MYLDGSVRSDRKGKELCDTIAIYMNEYITNFAEPCSSYNDSNIKLYYLPHYAVIKLDKETTKVRIVFDGSSHEPGKKPLNDNLFKGFNNWNSLNTK